MASLQIGNFLIGETPVVDKIRAQKKLPIAKKNHNALPKLAFEYSYV